MRHGYEFFDHTADVGVVVRAPTLPRLFEHAARALFELICDPESVRPKRRQRLDVEGANLEDLLVRWLMELLYRHETRGLVFSSCAVEGVSRVGFRARGTVTGEPIDRSRHHLRREVKAVTYHQMRLRRVGGAWRVRIVFDI